MAIRIYNTFTRRKEEFVPVHPGKVGIYSCGPTVYDYFHIGNARAFVVPDVIRRYLLYRGYEVTLVQNITDIEDKIIKRAHERGVKPEDIVAEYARAFIDDTEALGVRPPDVQPRATEHVEGMIKMISALVEKGLAYEADGDVYYDVSKFDPYGSLSGQNLDDLQAGARVEVGETKHDPLDFTLWKAAKPGEPAWDSPWGPGRPGWHIECSVMSTKYLGPVFDIHTGGVDLVFPHHENEIAQSHGANGEPPVKYWVHNGFVNIDGQRMGKSLHNFKTVRDILKKYPGKVVRYFLISNHYRKPINFSEDELSMCARALARIEGAVSNALFATGMVGWNREQLQQAAKAFAGDVQGGGVGEKAAALSEAARSARQAFEEAMDDDFNTAGAIAALHELATAINTYVNQGLEAGQRQLAEARATVAGAVLTMIELGDVVGILSFESVEAARAGAGTGAGAGEGAEGDVGQCDAGDADQLAEALIELLLEIRADVRALKQYALSDKIRGRLAEVGIMVEDTKDGARWKRVSQ